MYYYLIICIFITVFIFSVYAAETCKYSVYCDDSINQCLKKQKTDSSDIFSLILHQCSSPQFTYCNVYDSLLVKSESSAICLTDQKTFPSYPGGSCTNDDDCLFGSCYSGICKDSDVGKPCYIDENCPIGTACSNSICSPLKNKGEECITSTECQFDLVCYASKCIDAYSLEDGTDIGDYIDARDNSRQYCKSGGYYRYNSKFYCGTLLNKEETCREECTYKVKSTDIEVTMSSNCLCGYNKERSKHCILGNGEPYYITFLNMRKEFVHNKEYTKYCHTTERNNEDICVELKKINRTVSFRKYAQQYNNAKILALEHHRLINSDSCVKEVMFSYSTRPIIPDSQECPIVKCDSTISHCVEGTNPFNEKGDGIVLSLNDQICKEDEVCMIGNTKRTMSNIYLYPNVTGECRNQNNNITSRYPGEDCDNMNSFCVVEGSQCIEGKCSGGNIGSSCKSNENCIAGLYCSEDKTCKPQKKESESCKSLWECENYLGCYKERCTLFGSVENGQGISSEEIPIEDSAIRTMFCKHGKTDKNVKTCAEIDYANETYDKSVLSEDHFVECKKNEVCYYFDGTTYYNASCGCGYNEEGKGYCPLPNKYYPENWSERVKFKAEMTNNKCHTLNRFNCYSKRTKEMYLMERRISSKTIEAHLFHNATDCAYTIFEGSSYITNSMLKYVMVVILLLI